MKYIYQLTTQIYLHRLYQCYQRVVTINKKPVGPLGTYVSLFKQGKLSPFYNEDNWGNRCGAVCGCGGSSGSGCLYGICCFDSPNDFLCVDDMDTLISFLIENGYTINYETSKLFIKNTKLNQSNNFLFFIEYDDGV